VTIEDHDIIRGTTTTTLLECFGRNFRSTSGGMGFLSSGEDLYDKSNKVNDLDIFLSHSWHASWRLKYLTLLFYFNSIPAIVFSVIVSMICTVVSEHDSESTSDFSAINFDSKNNNTGCWNIADDRLMASWIGPLALLGMLLTWHRIINLFERCRCYIFLDKVCIHQTDKVLKEKGIQSIGGILAHSKMVLVAWDSSYFQRLWCTYELSAFRHSFPEGRVKVIPIQIASFVVITFLMFLWEQIFQDIFDGAPFKPLPAVYMFFFPMIPLFISLKFVGKFLHHVQTFDKQLQEFSVRNARCFCCDNDHLANGQELLCDREIVEGSIAHWHGKGDRDYGIGKFDKMVRRNLRSDMQNTLGSFCPYSFAVMLGLPSFFRTSDYDYKYQIMPRPRPPVPTWLKTCLGLEELLLRTPLFVVLYFVLAQTIILVQRRLKEDTTRARIWAFDFVLSLVAVFVIRLYNRTMSWVMRCTRWAWVAVSLEVLLVLFFYLRSPQSRRAQLNQSWEEQEDFEESRARPRSESSVTSIRSFALPLWGFRPSPHHQRHRRDTEIDVSEVELQQMRSME